MTKKDGRSTPEEKEELEELKYEKQKLQSDCDKAKKVRSIE